MEYCHCGSVGAYLRGGNRLKEEKLRELTRCQPVLASPCRRSSGPGGLSSWQVVCRVCSLSRLLVIKSAVCCKKLVNMR